jgi:hypothetical protein
MSEVMCKEDICTSNDYKPSVCGGEPQTLFRFESPGKHYNLECSGCARRGTSLFLPEVNLKEARQVLLTKGLANCDRCIIYVLRDRCDLVRVNKQVQKMTLAEFDQYWKVRVDY